MWHNFQFNYYFYGYAQDCRDGSAVKSGYIDKVWYIYKVEYYSTIKGVKYQITVYHRLTLKAPL